MKSIGSLMSGLGLFALPVFLHAQLLSQPVSSGGDANPSPPDSIVAVTADAYGLTQLSPEVLPISGTYWVVEANGVMPPFPGLPPQFCNCPTWEIADGIYLVDGTGGVVATTPPLLRRTQSAVSSAGAVAAAADAEGNQIADLIERVQDAQMLQMTATMMGIPMPGDGGGDGGGGDYTGSGFVEYSFDHTLLWLEITNVSNGQTFANLHNGTNQVYSIWSTTNLATTPASWQVETELWPTDTNCQPFSLQNLDRQNLFLRAEDWTGVDSDGDGVPDWWIWQYFHTLGLNATNLDSLGNSLLYDYTNRFDPNVISFTASATNYFVNQTTVPVQINLQGGSPAYYAVLVNDTNNADAVWQPFTGTNLIVNLGLSDGAYDVWVGLKGWPTNATVSWDTDDLIFTLDRSAPAVSVTSAVNTTVIKPYLQLQGFANKPLASLSYDINNAFGFTTGQDMFVTDQVFDTNRFDFTTNYFQAIDVPLATNENYITLRVTDRMGNTTTTNFMVTLDYSTATNPPTVVLVWPQDGMTVAGTNLTIRGLTSDETGTVQAQAVDGSGNTNLVTGIVERDGTFWIENLPLNGTNQISLQVLDVAGKMTTTNFTVMSSDYLLTLDETPSGSGLWQASGTVFGTVGDGDATVTVNGVTVTNYTPNYDGTYSWTASDVPLTSGGTAAFNLTAQSPGQPVQNLYQEIGKDACVLITEHHVTKSTTETDSDGKTTGSSSYSRSKDYWTLYSVTNAAVLGGRSYMGHLLENSGGGSGTNVSWTTNEMMWSDLDAWWSQQSSDGSSAMGFYFPEAWDDDLQMSGVPDQSLLAMGTEGQASPQWVYHYFAEGVHPHWHWDFNNGGYRDCRNDVVARTTVKLLVGGKAQVGRQNLFCLNAAAQEYGKSMEADYAGSFFGGWGSTPAWDLPNDRLRMMGKWVGADGKLWVVLPDGAPPLDVTVAAPAKHYNAQTTVQKYMPYITANDVRLDPSSINVTNCVGQKIVFKLQFDPAIPGGILITNRNNWVLPGKYVNAFKWFQPAFPPDGTGNYYISTCGPVNTWLDSDGYGIKEPYCTFYRQESWPLTQPETGAWWVSGGPEAVSCYPALTLANGQKVSLTVRGNFMSYRPSVQIQTNSIHIGPVFLDPIYLGSTSVGENISCTVFFNATILSGSCSGKANWIQLIKREYWGGLLGPIAYPLMNTFDEYYLDNDPFYNTENAAVGSPPATHPGGCQHYYYG
jgi:hypothetical protein